MPPTRRGTTCFGWRACLEVSRADRCAAAPTPFIDTHQGGRRSARVRRSHRVADLRRRCGAARRASSIERALPSGLYHCVNSGLLQLVGIRRRGGAAARPSSRGSSRSCSTKCPLRAKRPKYCALSNAKLASLGVTMPDWQDALRRSLEALNVVSGFLTRRSLAEAVRRTVTGRTRPPNPRPSVRPPGRPSSRATRCRPPESRAGFRCRA